MKSSANASVLLAGRVLISWIFLFSSYGQVTDFAANVTHVAAAGMPLPKFAIVASVVIQAICGLAILVGFKIRLAAWVAFVFLIPTTIVLHKFWGLAAPHQQEVQFAKNMALMGGLLFVSQLSAGAYSVDAMLGER